MASNQKTKRERFERIAARRVQRMLDSFDTLSKCSNRNNYEYDESDVQKMFKALRERLRTVETLFEENLQKRSKKTFKF